jgi:DNA processing protein
VSAQPGIKLTDEQLIDWLRLIRTEGVGPRTFFSLINHYGGAAEAIRVLPDLSRRRGAAPVQVPSREIAEKEIEAVRRFGGRFLARGEAAYPRALAVIDSAPPLLTIIGPVDLAKQPLVAVVGSRNASVAGLKIAENLSLDMASAGFGIVSGLARGIDTRAHEASLPTCSVAVVAGGLDRLYPEENRKLFEKLCERGAVATEMPFGWVPRGRDFPRRNRIVSGLCLGTVIVEAARKSGSLITARFANEQGRVVLAVPGSPLDQRAEGPNDLIREGATLVRHGQDALDALLPLVGRDMDVPVMKEGGDRREEPLWDEADWLDSGADAAMGPSDPPFDGWEEARPSTSIEVLRGLLTTVPIDADELARATGLSAREVHLALFELDQQGALDRQAGGRVSLRVNLQ